MASSPTTTAARSSDRPLTLEGLLDDLVADRLVTEEAADALIKNRKFARNRVHPLVVVADQKWKDPREPKKALHLETLTAWLATRCGLPYLHIDPFKIDFATVTRVMSNAYAERYHILPVAVNAKSCGSFGTASLMIVTVASLVLV